MAEAVRHGTKGRILERKIDQCPPNTALDPNCVFSTSSHFIMANQIAVPSTVQLDASTLNQSRIVSPGPVFAKTRKPFRVYNRLEFLSNNEKARVGQGHKIAARKGYTGTYDLVKTGESHITSTPSCKVPGLSCMMSGRPYSCNRVLIRVHPLKERIFAGGPIPFGWSFGRSETDGASEPLRLAFPQEISPAQKCMQDGTSTSPCSSKTMGGISGCARLADGFLGI